MFGIGGPELVIILVLALLLVGPDKLPQVVRTVGTGLRDLRRAANLAQSELRETMDDLVREVDLEGRREAATKAALQARDDAASTPSAQTESRDLPVLGPLPPDAGVPTIADQGGFAEPAQDAAPRRKVIDNRGFNIDLRRRLGILEPADVALPDTDPAPVAFAEGAMPEPDTLQEAPAAASAEPPETAAAAPPRNAFQPVSGTVARTTPPRRHDLAAADAAPESQPAATDVAAAPAADGADPEATTP